MSSTPATTSSDYLSEQIKKAKKRCSGGHHDNDDDNNNNNRNPSKSFDIDRNSKAVKRPAITVKARLARLEQQYAPSSSSLSASGHAGKKKMASKQEKTKNAEVLRQISKRLNK
eukprot:PhM_4_TR1670/c0_g1_i1/m.2244